jgi:flagellum-specific peptidoglycan hydrolase FlgJ
VKKTSADTNEANTFSNMPFDGELDSEQKRAEKIKKMKAYVKQYAKYAQAEMAKHGIPASITLAQGLLESDAGESRLAVNNNNHFGIKCFSRTCKRGHCSNFTDDTHKDFFRKYKTPAESFKAHSTLLQGARYKFLYQYREDDFVSWAKGLKKAGYATDPNYATKLINLIRELDLDNYDG